MDGATSSLAEAYGCGPRVVKGRALDRARFVSLVQYAAGEACWEWMGGRQKRPDGSPSYGYFSIGKKLHPLAHRLAWILVHGAIPDGLVIRHDCDNVACVRPDHLRVGTQAQNLADMWDRGRGVSRSFALGTAHHNAKLNPEKVRELRRAREDGLTFVQLGEMFGLHPTTAYAIVKLKTWAHVAEPEMQAAA